jgi:hypothetical protein
MAAPLVTQQQVVTALKNLIPKNYRVEIFDDYPSEIEVVRYGLYVSDLHSVERNPYQLAVNLGGNIYHVRDQCKIVYISFQDDPFNIQVNAFVSDLMSYVVPSTGIQLFDGYHERTFTQDVNYGTQAERHSWVLDLHRLEFQ